MCSKDQNILVNDGHLFCIFFKKKKALVAWNSYQYVKRSLTLRVHKSVSKNCVIRDQMYSDKGAIFRLTFKVSHVIFLEFVQPISRIHQSKDLETAW